MSKHALYLIAISVVLGWAVLAFTLDQWLDDGRHIPCALVMAGVVAVVSAILLAAGYAVMGR